MNDQKPGFKIRCEKCPAALFQDNQQRAEFQDNALIQAKTHGGLIFSSESVITICQRTEQLFRYSLSKVNNMILNEPNFPAVLCAKVLHDLLQDSLNSFVLFPSLQMHLYDDAPEEGNLHIYNLAKRVCQTYIKLRMFSATKSASQSLTGPKIRHHLTCQIIWQHQ